MSTSMCVYRAVLATCTSRYWRLLRPSNWNLRVPVYSSFVLQNAIAIFVIGQLPTVQNTVIKIVNLDSPRSRSHAIKKKHKALDQNQLSGSGLFTVSNSGLLSGL